ncbi:MAG TPA: glycosyltransferase family 2 protein [Usitatibacteraceae bacterium]|nr:glycosyltransferase family 2 protein [Usitatibacteraceae bacterium]
MIQGKKVIVVLPAYNAGKTLERTVAAIPREGVDDIILVDDASRDETVRVARSLGLGEVLVHPRNSGYGANQKTCYRAALGRGADIVVMLHPDYQYDPRLIPAMAGMVASGIYGIVLASRILGSGSTGALAGGMPWWKYVANRALTAFQNLLTGAKLSEYHTGYRAYSAAALREIPFLANSDDFVFDNQLLVQAVAAGVPIGEVSCPTRYEPESSSISFARSVRYGLGVLGTTLAFRAWRWGLAKPRFLAFSAGDFVAGGGGAEDPVAREQVVHERDRARGEDL